MKTSLFVISHKKINMANYPDRLAFYVGPHKDELVGPSDYKDNSGVNINERNYTYCECTAIYWLSKNYDCDIIGIEHYRRLFYGWNFRPLSIKKTEKLLKKYDFIVMINWWLTKNNKDQFIASHGEKMFKVLENSFVKLYPEYLPSFNKVMKDHHLSWCNMFITSKKNFNEYTKFLFDILFEIEGNIEIPKDPYQRRIMGFISERILNIYLDHNKNLKVKECLVLPTKRYEKE